VTLPPDEGRSIIERWGAGQKVMGVSDGSSKGFTGTHAWKICIGPDNPNAIVGAGPVDGVAPTPARAEAQGQLSVLVVSSLLAQSGGLHRSQVTSICDNKAVLRRLLGQHRIDKMQAHKSSDTDLYLIYKAWLAKGHIAGTHVWVKGHQDKKGQVEGLSDSAKVNVEVDRLAGEAYSRPDYERTAPDIAVFPEEVYAVFTETGKVVGEMSPVVQRQCAAAELQEYQKEKHGLEDGRNDGVDWTSLHDFLPKKTPTQRALYVKQQNGYGCRLRHLCICSSG